MLIIISQLFCSELLFEFNDPAGDDYGNGEVVYPENPIFTKGIFDIISFKLFQEANFYIFSITVNCKIEPVTYHEFVYNYSLPEDFILPLIHIYIDMDHQDGSGFIESIQGAKVQIANECAWEKAVVFSSISQRYYTTLKSSQKNIINRVMIPDEINISKDKREILVKIPVSKLGEISEQWGFTVLMMGHDFSQTIKKNIYVLEVKSTASQFNFGGGDKGIFKSYSSNVIDMLTPYDKNQKTMLNSYDKKKGEYATVHAIYPLGSIVKKKSISGIVKHISEEKVVVNLGAVDGVIKGSHLIIDSRIVIIATDVFPELTIAEFLNKDDWQKIEINMPVSKWKENDED